jgi:hypothetical protein
MQAAAASSVRPLGIAAAIALAAQIAVTLATGAAQEPLERVLAPAAYAATLLAHPTALRVVFTIDSVFLVLYAAFFVQLARTLAPAGSRERTLAALAAAAMLLTALLDAIENQHILSLLAAAERGLAIDPSAIVAQAAASQVKFHVSYFAVFVIGLMLPRGRALDRLLAASCLLVQLPLGVAAFVAPPPYDDVLVYARWAFYLSGFLLLSSITRASGKSMPRLPATAFQTT